MNDLQIIIQSGKFRTLKRKTLKNIYLSLIIKQIFDVWG